MSDSEDGAENLLDYQSELRTAQARYRDTTNLTSAQVVFDWMIRPSTKEMALQHGNEMIPLHSQMTRHQESLNMMQADLKANRDRLSQVKQAAKLSADQSQAVAHIVKNLLRCKNVAEIFDEQVAKEIQNTQELVRKSHGKCEKLSEDLKRVRIQLEKPSGVAFAIKTAQTSKFQSIRPWLELEAKSNLQELER